MNAPALPPPLPPVPRSTLVTVAGWVGLGLCTLGLIGLVVQAIVFSVLGSAGLLSKMQAQFALDPQAAAFFSAALRWLPWMAALLTLQNILFAVASIGMLKRREWARKLFIALLVLMVVWHFVWIPVQWLVVGHMQGLMMMGQEIPPQMRGTLQAQMEASLIVSRLFTVGFSLIFCGLYAWLILKLRTPRVRAEFAAARGAPASTAP